MKKQSQRGVTLTDYAMMAAVIVMCLFFFDVLFRKQAAVRTASSVKTILSDAPCPEPDSGDIFLDLSDECPKNPAGGPKQPEEPEEEED